MSDAHVRIPGRSVEEGGEDLGGPTAALVKQLNLLGREGDKAAGLLAKPFRDPPQSVAVIEAGATRLTKVVTTLGSGAFIATWGDLLGWWGEQETAVQGVSLIAASVVTAALVLGLGYVVGSDVRGRAAGSVAVVGARAEIAKAMIEAAEAAYKPAISDSTVVDIAPLPRGFAVRKTDESGEDELGWRAIAVQRRADGTINYVVVKGKNHTVVSPDALEFLG
jgi:hypothetical protein